VNWWYIGDFHEEGEAPYCHVFQAPDREAANERAEILQIGHDRSVQMASPIWFHEEDRRYIPIEDGELQHIVYFSYDDGRVLPLRISSNDDSKGWEEWQ
jgi:hypothetical protein